MTVMANQSIEIERLKAVMAIIPKIKFRAFRDSMGKLMGGLFGVFRPSRMPGCRGGLRPYLL